MFGISLPEIMVVFLVALIAFGPERLPELAKKLGQVSAELRKGTDALRREFYNTVYTPAPDYDRKTDRPLTTTKPQPAPEADSTCAKPPREDDADE